MTKIVTLVLGMTLLTCIPPKKEDLQGSRHIDNFVIEVTVLNQDGDAIEDEPTVSVNDGGFKASDRGVLQLPSKGKTLLIFEPSVTRNSIETISFEAAGYQNKTVVYSELQIDTYTPDSYVVKLHSTKGICDDLQPLFIYNKAQGFFIRFVQRVSDIFTQTAYAYGYEYSCGLTYRDRDSIEVVLEKN